MKISIIIPAHNEEDNIREVIDKIEDTLDIPYEIIVVNDHSSDNTPQVVRGLFARYQNIRLAETRDLRFLTKMTFQMQGNFWTA